MIKERRGEYQTLLNARDARPYIADKLPTRWVWRDSFRCEPGEIFFSLVEREFAQRVQASFSDDQPVLIEPHNKAKPEVVNKAWGWERWQALANLQSVPLVQVGPKNARTLDGVQRIETETFRDACAVLSVCRGYVGPEGGMHHAAAALGIPAVVLFSGFISPELTGYMEHRNIYHGGAPCGSRLPCTHCRESLDAISVEEVDANLKELLDV